MEKPRGDKVVGSGPHDVLHSDDDFYSVAIHILIYIISNDNKVMNPPRDLQIRAVYRQTLERMASLTLADLLTDRKEGPARAHLIRLCCARAIVQAVGRLNTLWPEIVTKALRKDKRWYQTTAPAVRRAIQGKPAPKTPQGKEQIVMGVRVSEIERFPGMYRPASRGPWDYSSVPSIECPSTTPFPDIDRLATGTPPYVDEDDDSVTIRASSPEPASEQCLPSMIKPAPRTPSLPPRPTTPEYPSSPPHGSSSVESFKMYSSSPTTHTPPSSGDRSVTPISPTNGAHAHALAAGGIQLLNLYTLRHRPVPFPPPDAAVDSLMGSFGAMSMEELHATIPAGVKTAIQGLDGLSAEEMAVVLPDLARLTLMEWHAPGEADEGKAEVPVDRSACDFWRMRFRREMPAEKACAGRK